MIAFFGAPGSGKSLQGQLLAARHDWRWLSTGQILRDSKNTDVLAKIKDGKMMSDKVILPLVKKAIIGAGDIERLVLDGFPRTADQVKWLLDDKNDLDRQLKLVIYISVSQKELNRRLNLRGRVDDSEKERQYRQELFKQQQEPIIKMLDNNRVPVIRISGDGSVGEVHDRIERILESCTLV